jgi:hypothetical protein
VRDAALVRRHREDDPLDTLQLALVYLLERRHLTPEAGDHLEHTLERAHPLQHLEALEEVVEAELALHHAALELLLLVLFNRGLGALDEG